MDEELQEPLEGYKVLYKDKFRQVAEEYFEELKEKSKVDIEENHTTCAELYDKRDNKAKYQKQLNTKKSINTFLTVLIVISVIVTLIAINLLCTDGVETIEIITLIVAIVVFVGAILGKVLGLKKKIKELKALIDDLEKNIQILEKTASAQMAPLNALFDWNIPVILTRKTIPTLELDQYFDAKKYYYLKQKYGLDHSDIDSSSEFVQSGQILGNPFIICRDYVHHTITKTYSNSITIHWTTTVHTKNGTRVVHHSQTLTAYVHAPAPDYYHSTYLIYGNEAAPKLTFSRMPTDVENMTDKQIEKFVKKEVKRLNKKETEALTDKNSNTNYSRFGNDEFETIFGGTNRNNDVEFNLLFTPLAQSNILKLLKDKEKIGFGDDFAFEKERCLNLVQSEHSQRFDYRANPIKFIGYDYEEMKKRFIEYNCTWFKSFYFDLAPVLSIPLYQQHKSKEFIYKDVINANLSEYEYEVMANQFDANLLRPEGAITPNIYKTEYVRSLGNSDEFRVTAHAFRGERRVTYVTKWGRDGRNHIIPVHWIEYFPIEKTTTMMINKNNQSRYDFNNTSHANIGKAFSHFERGLIGLIAYDTLFGGEDVVAQAETIEGFDLERTIAQLEQELDREDSNNSSYNTDNIDDSLLGEEKEVSSDDVSVSSDEDDEADEDESEDEE